MSTIAELILKVNYSQLKAANDELDRLSKNSSKVDKSIDKTGETVDKTERKFDSFGRTVQRAQRIISAWLSYKAIQQLVSYADTWKLLEARISLVTKNTSELNTVQKELFDLANKNRTSFEATATLYQKIARFNGQLGTSQREVLKLTDLVGKSLIISGANASEQYSVILQLSQALGSGRLQGDELRSITENGQRLSQALADGLTELGTFGTVTVGMLKEMGREGVLSSDLVVKALLTQSQVLESEYGKIPVTVGQAFTVLINNVQKYIGETDKALGLTSKFSQFILSVANNLDTLADSVFVLSSVFMPMLIRAIGTYLVGALIAARVAIIALFNSIRANPIGLLVTGLFLAVKWLITFGQTTEVIKGKQATFFDYAVAGWNYLSQVFGDVIDYISKAWGELMTSLHDVWGFVKEKINNVTQGLVDFFVNAWNKIKDKFLNMMSDLLSIAQDFLDYIDSGINIKTDIIDPTIKGVKIVEEKVNSIGNEVNKLATLTVEKGKEIGSAWQKAAEEIARARKAAAGEPVDLDIKPPKIPTYGVNDNEDTSKGSGRSGSTKKSPVEKTKEQVNEMLNIWKNMVNDMKNLLSNSIENALNNGTFKFRDFANEIRKIWNKMLANMIAEKLFQGVFGGIFDSILGSSGGFGSLFASGSSSSVPIPVAKPNINAYAAGGVIKSPQVAIYGEGANNEAVVPLPDGRTIPVTMTNGSSNINVVMNINGVQDVSQFRKSKQQITEELASSIKRKLG